MKTNNQNSISLLVAREKNPGLAIFLAAVFVVTAFSVVFAIHANAQKPLTSPREACQFYQNRWEKGLISVVRDTENECLVKVGDNNTGFGYIRGYYSGNKFCLDSYGAYFNNAGLSDSSECTTISQPGREQQQQKSSPGEIVTPPSLKTLEQTAPPLTPFIVGGVILGIIMIFVKRKQIFLASEKREAGSHGRIDNGGKKEKTDRKGLAIASFVVGIFTTVASLILFSTLLSNLFPLNLMLIFIDYSQFFFIAGIIGLILGIIGSRSSKKIFAILGIILNIIGILLWYDNLLG